MRLNDETIYPPSSYMGIGYEHGVIPDCCIDLPSRYLTGWGILGIAGSVPFDALVVTGGNMILFEAKSYPVSMFSGSLGDVSASLTQSDKSPYRIQELLPI